MDKLTKAFTLGELRYDVERDLERSRNSLGLFDGKPGAEAWVASRRRRIEDDEASLRDIEEALEGLVE